MTARDALEKALESMPCCYEGSIGNAHRTYCQRTIAALHLGTLAALDAALAAPTVTLPVRWVRGRAGMLLFLGTLYAGNIWKRGDEYRYETDKGGEGFPTLAAAQAALLREVGGG